MNTKLVLGGGAAVLIAAVVAFAVRQDDASEDVADVPAVRTAEETPLIADLAEPGAAVQEAPATAVERAPEADEDWTDDQGRTWEPLEFGETQWKLNDDGSLTIRKLARITYPDGRVVEMPVMGTAVPQVRPVPRKRHTAEDGSQPMTGPGQDG